MNLSKTSKWRDGNGNGNANADAKVSTIALPVLCTGELKKKFCYNFLSTNKAFKNKSSVFVVYMYVSPSCIYIHALVVTSLRPKKKEMSCFQLHPPK